MDIITEYQLGVAELFYAKKRYEMKKTYELILPKLHQILCELNFTQEVKKEMIELKEKGLEPSALNSKLSKIHVLKYWEKITEYIELSDKFFQKKEFDNLTSAYFRMSINLIYKKAFSTHQEWFDLNPNNQKSFFSMFDYLNENNFFIKTHNRIGINKRTLFNTINQHLRKRFIKTLDEQKKYSFTIEYNNRAVATVKDYGSNFVDIIPIQLGFKDFFSLNEYNNLIQCVSWLNKGCLREENGKSLSYTKPGLEGLEALRPYAKEYLSFNDYLLQNKISEDQLIKDSIEEHEYKIVHYSLIGNEKVMAEIKEMISYIENAISTTQNDIIEYCSVMPLSYLLEEKAVDGLLFIHSLKRADDIVDLINIYEKEILRDEIRKGITSFQSNIKSLEQVFVNGFQGVSKQLYEMNSNLSSIKDNSQSITSSIKRQENLVAKQNILLESIKNINERGFAKTVSQLSAIDSSMDAVRRSVANIGVDVDVTVNNEVNFDIW